MVPKINFLEINCNHVPTNCFQYVYSSSPQSKKFFGENLWSSLVVGGKRKISKANNVMETRQIVIENL